MRAVLFAIASVGLVGCVGSLDSGNGGAGGGGSNTVGTGTNPNPVGSASMAEQMFETNVYPIIHSGASSASDCSQCHDAKQPEGNTVGFVADDVADSYATITSFQQVVGNFTPAEAGIVTQVANGHNARMYTPDQSAAITAWLAEEVTERAGTGGGTSGTETDDQATARVLNQWSGCMTLTDFNSANMATAWGNMTTNNNSKCETCHVNGYMGFIATQIATTVDGGSPGLFTELQTSVTYMTPYFTVDLSGGPSAAKVVINTTAFMGVSQAQPPHVDHDEFNATNNPGMTALQTFYTSTMAHVTAAGPNGTCSPSLLSPPPT